MRHILACLFLLASFGALSAAPAPDTPKLPPEVVDWIRMRRGFRDGDIKGYEDLIRMRKTQQEKARLREKIRHCQREYYDLIIRYLRAVRNYPDRALTQTPEFTLGMRRAVERATRDFEQQRAEAVRRGEIPDRPPEPKAARNP
jgi:hypothetical protein